MVVATGNSALNSGVSELSRIRGRLLIKRSSHWAGELPHVSFELLTNLNFSNCATQVHLAAITRFVAEKMPR